MAGIEAMEGVGKLCPEGVDQIADTLRADGMTQEAMTELKTQLGDKLKPLFDLDDGEVKMLNALPPETVDTLFHICNRAVSSGGKIEYQRQDSGGPKMELGYTEHVTHKPDDGGGPKSVGHAKITCFK